jgi:hypothetical protein
MDSTVSMSLVLWATIAQFIVGTIWYTPVFGRIWGKIHGFDKLSKAEQKEAQKTMAPLLITQLLLTLMTSYVLAHVIRAFPDTNAYKLALWMWVGFIVPTQIAAVIFGGTKPQWYVTKSLIMAGGSLACVLVAAFILR